MIPPQFRLAVSVLILLAYSLIHHSAVAQQLTGTLSGTVYDQSGAVIPGAKITLRNQISGDVRTRHRRWLRPFRHHRRPAGDLLGRHCGSGFTTWQENDIVMNQGDDSRRSQHQAEDRRRATKVEVIGGAGAVVPTDTAEISTSINEKMINDFPLQGRDAGELLKIMPGMALNNGGSQGRASTTRLSAPTTARSAQYSSNGTQPYGTMAYMLDGANLVDPGNFGTQIANINQDMVGSIKMLTSNYSAEYAKGPIDFPGLQQKRRPAVPRRSLPLHSQRRSQFRRRLHQEPGRHQCGSELLLHGRQRRRPGAAAVG